MTRSLVSITVTLDVDHDKLRALPGYPGSGGDPSDPDLPLTGAEILLSESADVLLNVAKILLAKIDAESFLASFESERIDADVV